MGYEQDKHRKFIICPSNTNEDITVSVPVEIRAFAEVDEIVLKCKGHHIEKESDEHAVSKFKIVQKIHAHIPIKCFVECEVKDESVDFDVDEHKN